MLEGSQSVTAVSNLTKWTLHRTTVLDFFCVVWFTNYWYEYILGSHWVKIRILCTNSLPSKVTKIRVKEIKLEASSSPSGTLLVTWKTKRLRTRSFFFWLLRPHPNLRLITPLHGVQDSDGAMYNTFTFTFTFTFTNPIIEPDAKGLKWAFISMSPSETLAEASSNEIRDCG